MASPYLRCLKRCGFTGIAPQAMPIRAKIKSDMGPICTKGFRVMRCCSLGV